MSFSKHLLGAVFLGGALFIAATLPLTMFSSQPLTIQSENQPIFEGEVKDLSVPYLGLVLAISIGGGATHFAMMRWQQAARKLARTEDHMNALKQKLHEQETLIEKLNFAPARLQSSGLESFLRNEPQFAPEERSQAKQPKRKKPPAPKRQTSIKPEGVSQNNKAQQVGLKTRSSLAET